MAKRCIYCKNGIDDNSVVDVCDRCGVGVWGPKMFQAIKDSMENSREKGDLFQGSVSSPEVHTTGRNRTIGSASPRKV